MQTLVLGGGCFWCTESVFQSVKGVERVTSGYMGGDETSANYRDVCSGRTGHIEVVRVDFDDTVVPLEIILDIFFATHDPTTRDRQGNDIGSQYRSVVFYTDEQKQKPTIDRVIGKLRDEMGLDVVTEVHPVHEFYAAEDEHQDYFNKNPTQGYCQAVIPPKIGKIQKSFKEYLIK